MSGKKGRRKNDVMLADVTVEMFANTKSRGSKGRISKSAITSDINTMIENDNLAWSDNKAINDEDTDSIFQVTEDGTNTITTVKEHTTRRNRAIPVDEREVVEYPFCVWLLISEHVRPEDVGRFAGINKNTLAVTRTASFWFNLYRKFYRKDCKLPECLRPECMTRLYFLRQRVIRTLYFTYEPFVNKLNQNMNDAEPHDLITRRCIMLWYRKQISHWVFYFKLKVVNLFRYRSEHRSPDSDINLSEIQNNHLDNDEEQCKILQVSCLSFYDVPMVMGMILSSVHLSQGVLHHRLQLGFRSGLYSKGLLPESSIILDNVVRIQLFDWWYPNYPHYKSRLPASDRIDEVDNIFLTLQPITE